MIPSIHHIRRAATNAALRGALAVTTKLPNPVIQATGRAVGAAAAAVLPMRKRLRTNMQLALGADNVPPLADERYFRRLGVWAGWEARVFKCGLANSGVPGHIEFEDTYPHLQQALAEGRGVVLAAPHAFAHEIGAGMFAQRHPVVALIRQSGSKVKQSIKERWYRSVGLETVTLARDASVKSEVRTCLKILREGKILGITPDLLAEPGDGVPITMFGRTVRVKAGIVVIAMYARAPLVTCLSNWKSDDHLEIRFTPPEHFTAGGEKRKSDDAEHTIQQGMQEWFSRFEQHLAERPEDWMFWLDKRWTKAIRSQGNNGKAESTS